MLLLVHTTVLRRLRHRRGKASGRSSKAPDVDVSRRGPRHVPRYPVQFVKGSRVQDSGQFLCRY